MLALSTLSVVLFSKGISNNEIEILTDKEQGNINYRVYLKDNNFFEEKFFDKVTLESKGKSIISSLIDKINITFTYTNEFNQSMNGKYYYQIKAIIEANKSENGNSNLWEKSFDLTEPKEMNFDNSFNYSIIETVNINYDEYNSLFNEFKKSNPNLSVDGILKVAMEVKWSASNEEFKTIPENGKEVVREFPMEIPLSKSYTDISMKADGFTENNTYKKETIKDDIKYTIYKVLAVVSLLIALLILIIVICSIQRRKQKYKNEIELKKILSAYDSIIVNVDTIPNIEEFNVIRVKSFDELIDAHSEVRMPINYYKCGNRNTFILINNNMLWIYILKCR